MDKPPQRKNREWNLPKNCPNCNKENSLREIFCLSISLVKGKEISSQVKKWICNECKASWMSPSQATEAAKTAIISYNNLPPHLK